jgi:Protein of unknown function (DUF4238)
MTHSAAHKLSDAPLDVNKLPNAKNQHYVWRYYLTAWTTDGNFWCYRYKAKSLFRTQPKSVANEHYFYEAYRLTTADEEFLERIIKQGADEELRKINRNFIRYSQATFRLRDLLQDKTFTREGRVEIEKALRWGETNLAEQYHGGIEHSAHDIIDALRRENDDFYNDDDRCVNFLYFLSNQYFRTAKIHRAMSSFPRNVPGHDPRRTIGIEAFIYATNFGRELFRERKQARIIFLKNETPNPFIAGDQPVINMLDPKQTTDVELYYPLAPTLAVILTKDSKRFPLQRRRVSQLELENYNYAIFQNSEDQAYSNDDAYLRSLVTIGKHVI